MRTENDEWDIVTGVGLTALGVATFRALETAVPDPLIHDEYAELFVRAAGEPHFLDILAEPPTLAGAPLVPGHMGLRTRWFDDYFLAAVAAGVRQFVILASGLDARAYRLDWPEDATVFEMDRPEVLAFKERVLAEHGVRARVDRRAVAVDLRSDWPAALAAHGADPRAATAWSAEGLLPYLPGAAHDRLFERIDALSPPGSRLAVEYTPTAAAIRGFSQVERKYFDKNPFGELDPTELFYADERIDPRSWLTERGWSVRAASPDDLAAEYGVTVPEFPEEVARQWRQPRYLDAGR
ncbi:MAG TPA: SAM-dependent methyltransferase [Nocardia sp.]|uniref:SAM-dependent methyltransferase n=1 Tax=Nocardia sp. TaxID=1821 RepID=UPI002B4B8430|nr:SAM-dependent methyltransferase [Nocardia sp.]HLS75825.1 SAM-dependent methyltransferase [Nocardia sp.]